MAPTGRRTSTVTGSGGVGKSRLALHVAARLVDRFPDEVWLVELAPLAEPDRVPDAVLAAMAIPPQLGRSALDAVLVATRTRQLLLVLDNCEHLLEGCARLAEALLKTCPHVRILTTSREALPVAGETRWRVPSLSLPPTQQHACLKPVADCEAVQLFLERAAAVQTSLPLTAATAPIVAEICTQLDGIPLALGAGSGAPEHHGRDSPVHYHGPGLATVSCVKQRLACATAPDHEPWH